MFPSSAPLTLLKSPAKEEKAAAPAHSLIHASRMEVFIYTSPVSTLYVGLVQRMQTLAMHREDTFHPEPGDIDAVSYNNCSEDVVKNCPPWQTHALQQGEQTWLPGSGARSVGGRRTGGHQQGPGQRPLVSISAFQAGVVFRH